MHVVYPLVTLDGIDGGNPMIGENVSFLGRTDPKVLAGAARVPI